MLLDVEKNNYQTGGGVLNPNQGATKPPGGVLSSTSPDPNHTSQPKIKTAPHDTVEGRLTNLLDKDNPYLINARNRGMEHANRRGLLNSSIAATSGEKAAIDAALPVAQQDAGYYQQQGLQSQQGDIQSRLQGEAGDIQSRIQGEAGGIESRHIGERGDVQAHLQRTQGNIQKELYKTQGDIQRELYETQGNISERLARQGFDHEVVMREMDTAWKEVDLQARMDVEYNRMDQDKKSRFDSTAAQITSEYQDKYMNILADPTFATTADRKVALDRLNRITQQRFDVAAKIADVDLNWTTYLPNWATGSSSTPGASSGSKPYRPGKAPKESEKPSWGDDY